MNKKRTFKEEWRLIIRGFKIEYSMCRAYFWLSIAKLFADKILPYVNLYMSALIVTKISQSAALRELIIYVLITVSINLIISTPPVIS